MRRNFLCFRPLNMPISTEQDPWIDWKTTHCGARGRPRKPSSLRRVGSLRELGDLGRWVRPPHCEPQWKLREPCWRDRHPAHRAHVAPSSAATCEGVQRILRTHSAEKAGGLLVPGPPQGQSALGIFGGGGQTVPAVIYFVFLFDSSRKNDTGVFFIIITNWKFLLHILIHEKWLWRQFGNCLFFFLATRR